VAIAELVQLSPVLRRAILAGADEVALREQARLDGTRTLLEVGCAKVLAGETVPEEVLSVAEGEAPHATEPAPSVPSAPADATGTAAPSRDAGPTLPGSEPWTCAHCGQPGLASARRHCTRCGTPAPARTAAAPVLVCDDNLVQRLLITGALKDEPGGVIEAVDGQSCLDALARLKPALLVIDQNMPGSTGIEVIRRIRSSLETATLPIIMLTGSDAEDFESIVFEAGADDYLTKPVAPDRLRARVRALLSARRRWSATA
jgi:CheY-like chemotaxis protein